jgi:hypothetical protein
MKQTFNITITYETDVWTNQSWFDTETEDIADILSDLQDEWFEEIGSTIPNFDWENYGVASDLV